MLEMRSSSFTLYWPLQFPRTDTVKVWLKGESKVSGFWRWNNTCLEEILKSSTCVILEIKDKEGNFNLSSDKWVERNSNLEQKKAST